MISIEIFHWSVDISYDFKWISCVNYFDNFCVFFINNVINNVIDNVINKIMLSIR